MAFSIKDIALKISLLLNPQSQQQFKQQVQQTLMQGTNPTAAVNNLGLIGGAIQGLIGLAGKLAAAFGVVFSLRSIKRWADDTVHEFGKFDKALQEGISIMDDVDEAMREKLGKRAIQVAKEMNIAASEVASGYYHLVASGLDAEQAYQALPAVAVFAKAAMLDVATATEQLTTANAAMGYSSKDAATNLAGLVRVANALAVSANLSNATIEQMSVAFNNKAAQGMRFLRKDAEETAAALGALAKQGWHGSVAGERLNMFLRNVTYAAEKQPEMFKKAGIAVFDHTGKMRNLADVIEDFEKHLGKLSAADQIAALRQLGLQQRTIDTTKAFIGQSGTIRDLETRIRAATGYIGTVANKQLENFQDRVGLIKRVFEEAKIEIGGKFAPVLLQLGKIVGNDDAGLIGTIRALGRWIKNNKDALGAIAITILTTVLGAFRLLMVVVEAVSGLLRVVLSPPLAFIAILFVTAAEGAKIFFEVLSKIAGWVGFDSLAEGLDKISTKLEAVASRFTAFTTGAAKSTVDGVKNFFDAFRSTHREDGPRVTDEIFKNLPSVTDNGSVIPTEDFDGGDDPKLSKAQRAADKRAALLESALNRMYKMVADFSKDTEDNMTLKVDKLEGMFQEAFEGKIPEHIKKTLDSLRELAHDDASFAVLKDKLDGVDPTLDADEKADIWAQTIQDMIDLQATIDPNITTWQKLEEAIAKAKKQLAGFRDEASKERNENVARDREAWEQYISQYSFIVTGATNAMTRMWGGVFRAMADGAHGIVITWKSVAKAVVGAVGSFLGAFAAKKATENGLLALEEVARGMAAAANPLMAWTAPMHFAAARQHGVVAALWAAAAGAGQAITAVSSAGGHHSGGGGSADVGGRKAETAAKKGPDINIYIDGVDPSNPRHQDLIGDTAREYAERHGGDVFIKPGRAP